MRPFEYVSPSSSAQAVSLLGTAWGNTEILAGGTDLLALMKDDVVAPKRLINIKEIKDLRGVSLSAQGLRIGALTTLGDLADDARVKKNYPALAEALIEAASPQIRNLATLGGNLCQRPRCWYFRNGHGLLAKDGSTSRVREGDNRYHAIFNTDGDALFVSASALAPALTALRATLVAEGPKGKTRKISAGVFLAAPKSETERETVLKPNEVLTSISIPISGLKSATYEVRHRHGLDWPYVTASVAFAEKNGVASDARVVLGHVAATQITAAAAMKVLDGARIDEATAARCADAAVQGAKPLSRNAYKVQLVKAAVKRAVLAAHNA